MVEYFLDPKVSSKGLTMLFLKYWESPSQHAQ